LFIKGSEDLGGGLTANFLFENDWNTASGNGNTGAKTTVAATTAGAPTDSTLANGAAFGNGEIKVGLAGGFGTLDLGSPNYASLSSHVTGQPFGTAIGSGFSATSVRLVRAENAVRYITPTFSGFNAVVYKSNKQTKAGTGIATDTSFSTSLGAYDQTGVQEVGANYANGPLAASFTNQKQDNKAVGTGTTETTYNTLGANYAIGNAKVYLLNQTKKLSDNSDKTSYTAVSASYTFGATTVMAQTGTLKDQAGTNNGKKSTLTGIGADYALSKRTTAYLRYDSIKDEAGVIAAAATIDGTGTTRTRTAVGLRHAF
jgi:predicted porin